MTKLSLKRWSGKTLRKTKCATFEKFLTYTTDEKKALGAKSALNCDCRGGVLSTGLGIKFYSDALGNNIPLLGVIPLQLMRTKYWDGTTNRYEDLLFYVDGVRGTLGRYVDVNGRIDRVAMRGIAYDTKGFTVVRKNKHTGVVVVGASGVFLCDIENNVINKSKYTKRAKELLPRFAPETFVNKFNLLRR